MITNEEIALATHCLAFALENGASGVRITLSKSLMNLVGMLNGEVDKTAHALDKSLQLQLFVNGRFGTFSSNRLEKDELESFILQAIDTVKMLEEDKFRSLPDPSRLAKDAVTGQELGLWDATAESITSARRKELAISSSFWARKAEAEKGFTLIAEEGEYSDSIFDSVTMDSQGLFARHTETSFEIGYEATVQDSEGNHYSNYWWDAAPFLKDLQLESCAQKACLRAAQAISPVSIDSCRTNLIVDSECAGKLVTPLLNALGGFAVQQKNSFLADKLGKKLFPDSLSIIDLPRVPGETGCRLFDSEGVATRELPVIENGVVKTFFINTYIGHKMGVEPTIEDATRVKLMPFGGCSTQEELLQKMIDGILVTGFNGGNSNAATGNFSYGIEGFLIRGGRKVHPVREMLITGDFISLWNNLVATANDARPCLSKLIPTLAFKDVSFSA
ncbi:MAG: TldD/PmbA family protein [Bacteroidales bacterium]|nr:TldD/PmbA family protein [Bacteroidales bacterium]